MKSKLHLKKNPTLGGFQRYVATMVKERGFGKETVPEIFMLFLEECGELAKAARKSQKIHSDKNSQAFDLHHEAADVFIYPRPRKQRVSPRMNGFSGAGFRSTGKPRRA